MSQYIAQFAAQDPRKLNERIRAVQNPNEKIVAITAYAVVSGYGTRPQHHAIVVYEKSSFVVPASEPS